MEKEAEAKGIKALDIEIPPPRPKRKPNAPYPRKPGPSSSQAKQLVSSSECNQQAFLDLEKVPLPEVFYVLHSIILLLFLFLVTDLLCFCFWFRKYQLGKKIKKRTAQG